MAGIQLVTGQTGRKVTPINDSNLYRGIVGGETCVLGVGEKMRAEIINNNTVRVYDGVFVDFGRVYSIDNGSYVDYTIETGQQGVTRYDIIGAQYTKTTSDGTLENVEPLVLKNKGASGNVDRQDINKGATTTQIGLYRVKIVNLTIEEVIPLFKSTKNLNSLLEDGKIGDSEWKTLVEWGGVNHYGVYYRKRNGIVTITANSGDPGLKLKKNTQTTLGTLPVGFRPNFEIVGSGTLKAVGGGYCQFNLTSDGSLKVHNLSNVDTIYWAFTFTFPV